MAYIGTKITVEDYEKLKLIAEHDNRSIAYVIREAVDNYLLEKLNDKSTQS